MAFDCVFYFTTKPYGSLVPYNGRNINQQNALKVTLTLLQLQLLLQLVEWLRLSPLRFVLSAVLGLQNKHQECTVICDQVQKLMTSVKLMDKDAIHTCASKDLDRGKLATDS